MDFIKHCAFMNIFPTVPTFVKFGLRILIVLWVGSVCRSLGEPCARLNS